MKISTVKKLDIATLDKWFVIIALVAVSYAGLAATCYNEATFGDCSSNTTVGPTNQGVCMFNHAKQAVVNFGPATTSGTGITYTTDSAGCLTYWDCDSGTGFHQLSQVEGSCPKQGDGVDCSPF